MEFTETDGLVWSATAFDLDSGDVLFAHETGRVLKTASIGKVFLLHTVLEQELAGRLSLDEPVTRRPSDWMDDSGLWYLMQAPTLSIYDLCALVGAVSDNHATNTLVRRVGIEAVEASTHALGYRDSALHDIIRWPRPPGGPQTLSSGTAAELADFMARLARKELLTPEACDMFRRWLGASMDCSMVPSGYNLDPLAHDFFDRGLWVWNKTGTMTTVRADIGVVMSPERRVAYAVLANWAPGDDRRDDALRIMREAGLVIREHVLAGSA